MSGSLNFGLRLMMSREAFERTGLMQLGSRAAQRYLFKLDAGRAAGGRSSADAAANAAGSDGRRTSASRIPSSPAAWIRRPRF